MNIGFKFELGNAFQTNNIFEKQLRVKPVAKTSLKELNKDITI